MIKTIVVTQKLDQRVDDPHIDVDELEALRRARVRETDRLTVENADLRRQLRMAKAPLRRDRR